MRLFKLEKDGEVSLEDFKSNPPPYVILSHTWGTDGDEVTFKDFLNDTAKSKSGYRKIQFCIDLAMKNNISYFWIDACCIDRSSSAELSESINSMYRWYKNALCCYVYLADVSTDPISNTWDYSDVAKSKWFTRAWTLQELLAPTHVEFYSQNGTRLGDKKSLEQLLSNTTKVPINALRGKSLSSFTVAERRLWSENRDATFPEDKAYSLQGIFGVFMSTIYGEGEENAFKRLWKEVDELLANEKPKIRIIGGVWNSSNVRSWEEASLYRGKPVKDDVIFVSPLEQDDFDIILGMKSLDCWSDVDMDFEAMVTYTNKSGFGIIVTTRTVFFAGRFTWLVIPRNDPYICAGTFANDGPIDNKRIEFPRRFSSKPQVVVWISGLSIKKGTGENVSFSESRVDEEGFYIHFEETHKTQLTRGAASWIAFTENAGVLQGVVKFRSRFPFIGEFEKVNFPVGKFHQPPLVFVAFKRLNLSVDGSLNARAYTLVDCVETTHFELNIFCWADTLLYGGDIHWLAIPREIN